MNYTEVINAIKDANLFDLYRLSVAIRHEMENPDRIKQLRQMFKEGDTVFYFSAAENRLRQAIVLQKNHKYVVVKNNDDQARWKIPYYLLNISKIDTDINTSHNRLSRNTLKVGEYVGFNNDGQTICGVIIRLNHKTVTFMTSSQHRGRGGYPCLFKVIDTDIVNQFDSKQTILWIQQENCEVGVSGIVNCEIM